MWQLQYKWATWTHPNKPKDWTVKQYFGTYHATRQDKWVFGDRKSGAYLPSLPGRRSSVTRRFRTGHHPMTRP